jgi:hypothetical protein
MISSSDLKADEGSHRLKQVVQFTDGLPFPSLDTTRPDTWTIDGPFRPSRGRTILHE